MNTQAFEQLNVPAEVRAFAEKSLEQARKAFDGFASAATEAASSLEERATAAQTGAKDVAKKAITFAERNVENSFDFVQKLVQAKDVGEVVKLHSDYVKGQIAVLSEQAKKLGQSATRMAAETAKPKGR